MKKQQFEEILSGIGLIATLLSYSIFGFNIITELIFLKFAIDTYIAIRLAYNAVFKIKKEKR